MALPPTSRISFLDTEGRPLAGPREWAPALAVLDVGVDSWTKTTLAFQGRITGARLEKVGDRQRVTVPWPRSGTGSYKLLLSSEDIREEQTVTIRPEKLSEQAYGQLIDDLENQLPVSIALALQRSGALSGVTITASHDATFAQELQRLIRAIRGIDGVRPGLAATLVRLSQEPHRVLRTENIWVNRDLARRPAATGLMRALARAGNLATDRRPVQVVDQRVEHTYDVYENRLLRLFHHQVALRLRAVRTTAEARRQDEVVGEVAALDSELRRARFAARFLDEVTLPNVLPVNLTMVLLQRPPYRAVLEGFLEFNRTPIVQLEQELLDAPLENLPALYQTWNTFVVIETLLEIAEERRLETVAHRLIHRRAGDLFVQVLPDGRQALSLRDRARGTLITLTPELTFSQSGGITSLSFSQRPDITISFDHPGKPLELIVLDPKYKLDSELSSEGALGGRPKKEDIDKMHAYRDAIRSEDNARPVRFAGILYPGDDVEYGLEVAAYSAIPGYTAALKSRLRRLIEQSLDQT